MKQGLRIVFMGTSDFAVRILRGLLLSKNNVLAVITQPDRPKGREKTPTAPPVKKFAQDKGLQVFQPRYPGKRTAAYISSHNPDCIVVAAYGKILKPYILAIPRLGCINVHASLLPKYRGAAPIQWAIANGEKKTGISIMLMNEKLDEGDILCQESLDILPDDTAVTLHDRLAELGAELLISALDLYASGRITPQPQNHAQATYAPQLSRQQGRISWDTPAVDVHNRVRAFYPWPGTFCTFKDKQLKIFPPTRVISSQGEPGTVLSMGNYGFVVACGMHSLLITSVQLAGKKRVPAAAFLQGARLQLGDKLL